MNVPDWLAIVRQAEQLFDQNQFAQADEFARQALAINPDCAEAHQVIGLVFARQDRSDEAMDWLERAISLRPDLPPSHNDLGMCYYKLEDLDRAMHHYELALIFQPDHAFAHFNRALAKLKLGDYHDGWIEYEWRWHTGQVARPSIPRPRWDGSPLNGRSILVHTEQGAGDVIQFIRLLPRLKEMGGRVVLACQKSLQPLLRNIDGVDDWFPIDQQADVNFDMYIPIMSLPSALKLTVDSIPRKVPYLFPEPDRVERWRTTLADVEGVKVGICWQGSPTFRGDKQRSIPLERLRPLAEVERVQLVSLQMLHGTEQLESWNGPPILDHVSDIDPSVGFQELAALMSQLDLVISVDTAVTHLAGASGRPVWTLLPMGSDWRWLANRQDSPWYPTMRLFRQHGPGGWQPLIPEVRNALEAFVREVTGVSLSPRSQTLFSSENSPVSETPQQPQLTPGPSEPVEPLTSVHTTNFPDILRQLNVSLAVTTYQAGKLVFLRPEGDHLNTHFRTFDRPMGLAYQNGHMALGCGIQIWEFFNTPAVVGKIDPPGPYDACFLPRRSHITGDIDIHEMVFGDDGKLWFVNTRFCCLCNVELTSNFVPVWRPPFVSGLAPEDRCHLNGVALVNGRPKYVTCLGTTDTPEGWREHKANGGVLIDVETNEVIVEGLSMPHSPRWYQDRLWLQESGTGTIGWVDLPAKKYNPICELPGFTRGMDFVGPLAFVGLSQVRETASFSGIPITQRLTERISGVYVVHIERGEIVAYLNFTGGVQELFAVQVLPGLLYPELVNEITDILKHAYVLPEEAMDEVATSQPQRRVEGTPGN